MLKKYYRCRKRVVYASPPIFDLSDWEVRIKVGQIYRGFEDSYDNKKAIYVSKKALWIPVEWMELCNSPAFFAITMK